MHTIINISALGTRRRGIQIIFFILAISLLLGACRKEVNNERVTSYYGKSWTEVFEAFWNGMNTNYVFWEIETVDWDNMYKTYKPRFEDLDLHKNDPKSAQLAVQYLVDMTKDLSDSHFEISFNGLGNYVIANYPVTSPVFQPSSIRHQLRGDRAPISARTFEEIIPKYYLTKAELGKDQYSFRMNMGVIPRNNKNILYLHYTSFQLGIQYYYGNNSTAPVKPVLDNFFRYTKDPSIDGLILDLRNNPGGAVSDLDFLVGRLITSDKHVSYTRTKNGSGRLDYTPWVKGYVHTQPGAVNFTKPIVVLVDQYSVSMAEMTTIAIKAIFPDAKVIGEKTWGGTGAIPQNDVRYMGGQFTAANFVHVYTAGIELRDKNLVSYENKGITPDITVAYDTAAIRNNIDVQLEKGIQHISSK
ncbi:MAG TPA: S41 family peptidase [Chitinophagaceae bacterium]